jgi:hypothetical protein
MAHFAELDAHDVVTRVIVVSNNELLDENGVESEAKGISFCQSLYGVDTKWVQTSYNASFRKNYAGKGYTYSQSLDAFVPIRPFPSWILNETFVIWEPPIPRPNDGNKYRWDEDSLSWVPL